MPLGSFIRSARKPNVPSLQDFGIPEKYAQSVDARQEKAVGNAALQRIAKYKLLSDRFNDAVSSKQPKKNVAEEQLRIMADDLLSTAMEIDPNKPGAEPAVVADIAAGLQQLRKDNPTFLEMAFRRASQAKPATDPSNPSAGALGEQALSETGDSTGAIDQLRELVFEDLAEVPNTEKPDVKKGMEQATQEIARQEKGFTQDDIPLVARLSQTLNDPSQAGTKKYDNYKVGKQITEAELIGDQKRQTRAIEKSGMTPTLPDPNVESTGRKSDPGTNPNLTIGTSAGTGFTADSAKWGGQKSASVDTTVENRNRGSRENVIRELMRVTDAPDSALAPSIASRPSPGQESVGQLFNAKARDTQSGQRQKGFALGDDELSGWLDQNVPEWRGRFQLIEPDGTVSYPNLAPNAKFLSYFLASRYEIENPKEFVARVEPFIQRAIDAAPPAAPKKRPKKGATGTTPRTPRGYDRTAFDMGKRMEKEARKGGPDPSNQKYPFPIYDSRGDQAKILDRPELSPQQGSRFYVPPEPLTQSDMPELGGLDLEGIDPNALNMPEQSPETPQSGRLEEGDMPPIDDLGYLVPINKQKRLSPLRNLLS